VKDSAFIIRKKRKQKKKKTKSQTHLLLDVTTANVGVRYIWFLNHLHHADRRL
jgi:hypothetical protein